MPLQHELAWLLRERCEEIGIAPQKLAQLSGIDLVIVEQLLGSAGGQTSIAHAECIANAVGLSLGVLGHGRRREGGGTATVIAARTASTSFREVLGTDTLVRSIKTGVPAADFRPHLRALLDEAPLGLLAGLAYELRDECGIRPAETWQKMRTMAVALGCLRSIWT